MSVSNSEEPNHRNYLAQRIVWLLSGKVIPALSLLAIMILYSNELSYEDYGKFQSIWMYAGIATVIICFGIPTLILSSDLDALRGRFKKHLPAITFFYAAITLLSFLLLPYIGHFSQHEAFIIILIVSVFAIANIVETLLVKLKKEVPLLFVNTGYSIVLLSWHYYNVQKPFEIHLLCLGVVFIFCLKIVCGLLFLNMKPVTPVHYDVPQFVRHWTSLGLNDILGVIAKWIDKIFIIYLLSPTQFAIFFNGTFEIPLFALLVSTVSSLLTVDIAANPKDKQRVIFLFKENFKLLSKIVFPLFLFLFFFNKEIFSLFFNTKYDSSIPLFAISIFILPVRINDYTIILQCLGKGNKILIGTLLDLVIAVSLMLCLYSLFSMKGVALSIVISTYIQASYYLYQSARVLKTEMKSLLPLKNLLVGFVIYLFLFFLLVLVLRNETLNIKLGISSTATAITILIGFGLHFKWVKKTSLE